ncbi:MAG: helix-turn-helix transcriptional regulator [Lachnospiraceae bacterium]|nr:helix-turn-helix transcriptional regulator [Lachnospiraceae bacterium]
MSVGENIRRIREEKELTQAYVAENAGISQAMLCQIERGTKNPSPPDWERNFFLIYPAVAAACEYSIRKILEKDKLIEYFLE